MFGRVRCSSDLVGNRLNRLVVMAEADRRSSHFVKVKAQGYVFYLRMVFVIPQLPTSPSNSLLTQREDYRTVMSNYMPACSG